MCVGNKVDLIPGHPVHAEYRRRLLNVEDDSVDYYAELKDCGISETEGSSLLGGDESTLEIRKTCLDWCVDHNIEYIEACASNADIDKCKILFVVVINLCIIAVYSWFCTRFILTYKLCGCCVLMNYRRKV